MARGRKKIENRDFRLEKVRAIEAAKFLKIKERDFYRLIEHGFIEASQSGFFELGAVVDGYLKFSQVREKLNIEKISLNFNEAAYILGMSKSSFYRLIEQGFIPSSHDGNGYRLTDLIKGYVESVTSIEELTQARIADIRAQTKILEYKISEQSGELFSAKIFTEIYEEIFEVVRARLSQIPSKVANLVLGCAPPPKFLYDYVKVDIDNVIHELSRYTGGKIKEEIFNRQVARRRN